MFRCRFCGREYKDRRSIHGHLMTSHREEYYKHGCIDADMIDELEDEELPVDRPVGFRLLNQKNDDERYAYSLGFRFIDAEENVYREEIVKAMGWI